MEAKANLISEQEREKKRKYNEKKKRFLFKGKTKRALLKGTRKIRLINKKQSGISSFKDRSSIQRLLPP